MTTVIIQPPHGGIEQWQADADRHCPQCGAKGVYLLESSATLYNSDIGLCLVCDTAWEWTYFSEEWIKARTLLIRKNLRAKGTAQA